MKESQRVRNRTQFRGFIVLVMLSLEFGCSDPNVGNNTFTIGFSQCTSFDDWRKTMQEEMDREMAFQDDLRLVIEDANGDNDKQIEQINNFIEMGVDLLIVSPNEAEPITPIIEKAYQKGIPVILIDRKTTSNFYTAFVGADNYTIGKTAGRYAVSLLGQQGTIIEIKGLKGSTPFIDRHEGFISEIKDYPNIKVLPVEGDWGYKKDAEAAFIDILSSGEKIDLVYAHNDIMALAAYNAVRANFPDSNLNIIGVDGLAGPNGGIQYVNDRILKATILYPTGGDRAIQIASDILHDRPFEKDNQLTTSVIDSTNVRVMLMQTNKIISYEKDINRMAEKINEQRTVFKSQQKLIYSLAVLFVITVISFAYSLKLLRERREINKSLNKRNQEITRQKNEIQEMSERAGAANQARIKFFSNVSHEFKTPLTLILGQLDEIQHISGLDPKQLILIRQNVMRLTRHVNQLMDYQKIENNKLRVHAGNYDLIDFLKQITEAFKPLVLRGSYRFNFVSEIPEIKLWFDKNMMDKVFFNLLSNAFKFTNERGKIAIQVNTDYSNNQVVVLVQDNGKGMTPTEAKRVFERYYQRDDSRADGTGLGLYLSKELVELHRGNLTVQSEEGNGTAFRVELKLGKEHFDENELISDDQMVIVDKELRYFFDEQVDLEQAVHESIKEQTILIMEDDKDLLLFLSNGLGKEYNVLTANNGEAGLEIALEQIPDLILCDKRMPKLDGMTVLQRIKSDPRTSHISFIMLTADDTLEDKISAIHAGADDFVSKPFSFQLLSERIKTILINRIKLREHYLHELPIETTDRPNLDKKFVNEFVKTVEENLNNPNLDVNVICETLGMSRVQLYRKVKSMLGYNVADYITGVRLKKAKYLLQKGDLTISEVGYEVGFSSASYFSSVFKNKLGLTPKEFQNSNR